MKAGIPSLYFDSPNGTPKSAITFNAPVSGLEEPSILRENSTFATPVATKNERVKEIILDEDFRELDRDINTSQSKIFFIAKRYFPAVLCVLGLLFINGVTVAVVVSQQEESGFVFNFLRRNNIKRLCGPNMDPQYAINGRFFAACGDGKAMVCEQNKDDPTLGELDEDSCTDEENLDIVCLCPDLVLFAPVEEKVEASDLCGSRRQRRPRECSVVRTSVDFLNNSISLTPDGLFSEMARMCGTDEGKQAQLCIHEGLRLECKDSDYEAKECEIEKEDICGCKKNTLIFPKVGQDEIPLCGGRGIKLDPDQRCAQTEEEL